MNLCSLDYHDLRIFSGGGATIREGALIMRKTVLHKIFFPSHITIFKTMDSSERGMDPATKTTINPWKEFSLSWGLNQQPPVLKSLVLLTELWGLARLVGCWLYWGLTLL